MLLSKSRMLVIVPSTEASELKRFKRRAQAFHEELILGKISAKHPAVMYSIERKARQGS